MKNYIAVERVCCTSEVGFLLIRNKSVLHVQSFFCQLQKKCAARAKCFFFLLIRSIVVVFYRSRCLHRVFRITRFYIFFEETINVKESFAFSPGLIYILRANHSAYEKKMKKKKNKQSILFLFIFSSKASKFSFPYE